MTILHKAPQNNRRGSTLIELAIGLTVMSVVFAGTLGAFVQSRRMTEASIYQNSATTVIQGYLEQIKNMDFWEIPYYSGSSLLRGTATSTDAKIYTQLDSETMDPLEISSCLPILPSAIVDGVAPAIEGLVDNYKLIDINDTPDSTDDDLKMHLWIWVSPMDSDTNGVGPTRCIRMVYTWAYNNGGISRSNTDSITTIRSVVPTF